MKGHLFLLDALKEMIKSSSVGEWKVLFTGEGPDDYKEIIIEKAKEYGLFDRIVFTGHVNPVDVLNIADIMVLPSKNEGFGIACIESFAMGVPVIRTKTAGYSDMKDCCIGIDYGDTEALCASIREVLSGGEKTLEMIEKAFCIFNNKFTAQKVAEKILKIYQGIVN